MASKRDLERPIRPASPMLRERSWSWSKSMTAACVAPTLSKGGSERVRPERETKMPKRMWARSSAANMPGIIAGGWSLANRPLSLIMSTSATPSRPKALTSMSSIMPSMLASPKTTMPCAMVRAMTSSVTCESRCLSIVIMWARAASSARSRPPLWSESAISKACMLAMSFSMGLGPMVRGGTLKGKALNSSYDTMPSMFLSALSSICP
mmetsp:Transcript_37389/g.93836  ORF Transcript_37389/g.93836 Transcript_37389/m.93836 type:complete len:209 (-) Transcript_37389:895-1521(-)